MAESLRTKETINVQSTDNTSPGVRTAASESHNGTTGYGMDHKGLKGLLLMAVCCGAPLLLLLALPLVGSVLGGLGTSVISVLALLACPVGMALMMWMMRRGQQAGAQLPAHGLSASPPQAAGPVSAERQEAAGLSDTPVTLAASVTPAPDRQGVLTPPPAGNGHQATEAIPSGNGQGIRLTT